MDILKHFYQITIPATENGLHHYVYPIWWFVPIIMLWFCTNTEDQSTLLPTDLSGEQLAEQFCGSCHEFVEPEFLTKTIWKEDVLPAMGQRLGIYINTENPYSLYDNSDDIELVKKANIFPEKPVLAHEDWQKIVDYYVSEAPDTIIKTSNPKMIQIGLEHFAKHEVASERLPPLTNMVKILPDKRGIVLADAKPDVNKLIFLDVKLQKTNELNFKTDPVHYYEKSDTIYLTTIGQSPFPNDRSDGDIQIVYKGPSSHTYNKSKIILTDLRRPVDVVYGDINGDNRQDLIVCEFGNQLGQLSLFLNTGEGQYHKQILRHATGAVHAKIIDLNKDGLRDVVALMSQGREGIFYYENGGPKPKTDGPEISFTEKQLLSFSPLYGSVYFELHDFNGDHHPDILYVCGDNADKTPILKAYHGVYIFLNDGRNNFTQSYFYHQNGAFKSIARDFDLDGDLDIASISFFPDYENNPEESFVYLENTGELKFVPYSFPHSAVGRWMVMDDGDLDGDGDLDIALGSFVYFKAKGDTTGLNKLWMEQGPSLVVLENTIK